MQKAQLADVYISTLGIDAATHERWVGRKNAEQLPA
jgi:hypothetical protein